MLGHTQIWEWVNARFNLQISNKLKYKEFQKLDQEQGLWQVQKFLEEEKKQPVKN